MAVGREGVSVSLGSRVKVGLGNKTGVGLDVGLEVQLISKVKINTRQHKNVR